MTSTRSSVVADGPERLRAAADYAAVRQRIVAEVRQRHRAEPGSASFWREVWLAVKIRREVQAELRKVFPPGALHVAEQAN